MTPIIAAFLRACRAARGNDPFVEMVHAHAKNFGMADRKGNTRFRVLPEPQRREDLRLVEPNTSN